MSALSRYADEVEEELGAAWRRYHVGAQLRRFLSGVLVTLLWSIHSGFTDWTDLLPLAATAAWTTAAQMWPTVPWSLLKSHLEVGSASGTAPSATAPAPPVKG